MPGPKTWIERNLGLKQTERLVDYLLDRTTEPTGRQIKEAIAYLFPAKKAPNAKACLRWRHARWKTMLRRRDLQASAEAAKLIVPDNSEALDKANIAGLQALVFERLQGAMDGEEEISPAFIDDVTACTTALARSQRETDESEERIRDDKERWKDEDAKRAEANKPLSELERVNQLNRIMNIPEMTQEDLDKENREREEARRRLKEENPALAEAQEMAREADKKARKAMKDLNRKRIQRAPAAVIAKAEAKADAAIEEKRRIWKIAYE